jgi:FLVCR family MFS transporter 7
MGAALLLSGIVAAVVTSPIFDRVLTHHLGITVRTLCPFIGVLWLSFIWAGQTAVLLFTHDLF